jgi:hypothetical protein
LQKLAVVRAKNANFFGKFFGENILKIKTSFPGRHLATTIPTRKAVAPVRKLLRAISRKTGTARL